MVSVWGIIGIASLRSCTIPWNHGIPPKTHRTEPIKRDQTGVAAICRLDRRGATMERAVFFFVSPVTFYILLLFFFAADKRGLDSHLHLARESGIGKPRPGCCQRQSVWHNAHGQFIFFFSFILFLKAETSRGSSSVSCL